MNAFELADYLQNKAEVELNPRLQESATMLRQQQAELDAFKLQYYNTGYSIQLRDKDETIRQQQAEIEALKHQVTGLKLSWQCETDIVEKQQALIAEQDKKIIELAFRAVYAERSNEVVKELSK